MKRIKNQKIMLFGFRRNGTTMTFELFRKLGIYTCFYEPFHPQLFQHKDWQGRTDYERNAKNAYTEYSKIFPEVIDYYRPLGAPVYHVRQELEEKYCTDGHIKYLKYLLDSFDNVLLQPVRINCHLNIIYKNLSDYQIKWIWILRDPEGYVSSILKRNRNIFSIEDSFMHRLYCKLFGNTLGDFWSQDKTAEYIICKNKDMYKSLKTEKLYVKLLLTWFHTFKTTIKFLKGLNQNQFAIIKYEDLCKDPTLIMGQIKNWLDLDIEMNNYEWGKTIKQNSIYGVDHENPLWSKNKQKLMNMLNIPLNDWFYYNRTIVPINRS